MAPATAARRKKPKQSQLVDVRKSRVGVPQRPLAPPTDAVVIDKCRPVVLSSSSSNDENEDSSSSSSSSESSSDSSSDSSSSSSSDSSASSTSTTKDEDSLLESVVGIRTVSSAGGGGSFQAMENAETGSLALSSLGQSSQTSTGDGDSSSSSSSSSDLDNQSSDSSVSSSSGSGSDSSSSDSSSEKLENEEDNNDDDDEDSHSGIGSQILLYPTAARESHLAAASAMPPFPSISASQQQSQLRQPQAQNMISVSDHHHHHHSHHHHHHHPYSLKDCYYYDDNVSELNSSFDSSFDDQDDFSHSLYNEDDEDDEEEGSGFLDQPLRVVVSRVPPPRPESPTLNLPATLLADLGASSVGAKSSQQQYLSSYALAPGGSSAPSSICGISSHSAADRIRVPSPPASPLPPPSRTCSASPRISRKKDMNKLGTIDVSGMVAATLSPRAVYPPASAATQAQLDSQCGAAAAISPKSARSRRSWLQLLQRPSVKQLSKQGQQDNKRDDQQQHRGHHHKTKKRHASSRKHNKKANHHQSNSSTDNRSGATDMAVAASHQQVSPGKKSPAKTPPRSGANSSTIRDSRLISNPPSISSPSMSDGSSSVMAKASPRKKTKRWLSRLLQNNNHKQKQSCSSSPDSRAARGGSFDIYEEDFDLKDITINSAWSPPPPPPTTPPPPPTSSPPSSPLRHLRMPSRQQAQQQSLQLTMSTSSSSSPQQQQRRRRSSVRTKNKNMVQTFSVEADASSIVGGGHSVASRASRSRSCRSRSRCSSISSRSQSGVRGGSSSLHVRGGGSTIQSTNSSSNSLTSHSGELQYHQGGRADMKGDDDFVLDEIFVATG